MSTAEGTTGDGDPSADPPGESSSADVSRARAWIMAARPQTLPAGAAPVLVGTGLALNRGVFALVPALAALVGALLIQVGTNFANDYYDAVKGTDAPDREGFTRVTAGGIIQPARVKAATVLTFGLAVLVGLSLVAVGGLPILVVGVSGILAGVLYTGGPWPYGYRGLGDPFVFVYFGLVAVTGTYYVQAVATGAPLVPSLAAAPVAPPPGSVPLAALLASLAPAGLATAILVVNNVRDREEDAAAGKRTLAVKLGYRASRIEFLALVALAYLAPVALVLATDVGPWALAPIATLPLAVGVARTVLTETTGDALNPALERVGQTLFAHAVLFALGLAAPVVL